MFIIFLISLILANISSDSESFSGQTQINYAEEMQALTEFLEIERKEEAILRPILQEMENSFSLPTTEKEILESPKSKRNEILMKLYEKLFNESLEKSKISEKIKEKLKKAGKKLFSKKMAKLIGKFGIRVFLRIAKFYIPAPIYDLIEESELVGGFIKKISGKDWTRKVQKIVEESNARLLQDIEDANAKLLRNIDLLLAKSNPKVGECE